MALARGLAAPAHPRVEAAIWERRSPAHLQASRLRPVGTQVQFADQAQVEGDWELAPGPSSIAYCLDEALNLSRAHHQVLGAVSERATPNWGQVVAPDVLG